MKRTVLVIFICGLLTGIGVQDARSDTQKPAPAAQKDKDVPPAPQKPAASTQEQKLVYVPPTRGAPKSRVGGGTRGVDPNALIIRLLAPEDVGYSASDQPVFYWYLSDAADLPLEITLIDDVSVEPILEIRGNASRIQGIQKVMMADYGIHLRPDVEYQWSVALVVDPEQRSRDVFATATIIHVPAPELLRADVAASESADIPSIYAAGGYWYDAIEAVSLLIESRPDDESLREQRAALAEQVALPEVAGHDREFIASRR